MVTAKKSNAPSKNNEGEQYYEIWSTENRLDVASKIVTLPKQIDTVTLEDLQEKLILVQEEIAAIEAIKVLDK